MFYKKETVIKMIYYKEKPASSVDDLKNENTEV